jgi:hypothetical protein
MSELQANNSGIAASAAFAGACVQCLVRAVVRPAYGLKAENGNHLSFRSAGPQSPLAEALSERSFV